MKYYRIGNDLYTGLTAPSEDAVEITAEEYNEILASRTLVHFPPTEDEEATEQDYLNALAELGVNV